MLEVEMRTRQKHRRTRRKGRDDRHLQSAISRFCGHYCIFYCLHRCRGSSVNAVVGKLTLDTGLNDYLIHKYICHVLK